MISIIGCAAFAVQGGSISGIFKVKDAGDCFIYVIPESDQEEDWACDSADLSSGRWFDRQVGNTVVRIFAHVKAGDAIAVKCWQLQEVKP